MSQQNRPRPKLNWKTQTYVIGVLFGAVMGFLSAYLFAQEAEDEIEDEQRPKIPPTRILTLATAAMSLVRQIAESASKDRKK